MKACARCAGGRGGAARPRGGLLYAARRTVRRASDRMCAQYAQRRVLNQCRDGILCLRLVHDDELRRVAEVTLLRPPATSLPEGHLLGHGQASGRPIASHRVQMPLRIAPDDRGDPNAQVVDEPLSCPPPGAKPPLASTARLLRRGHV
eukprot:CAMPEP_0117598418 /NCGR_PEP_ID=MMETSP0784-20121206/75389_1 /TAXON_ID=39447 /ORGANISM="" /LENGTH=147 /DNA_ID=CAMNT_0005400873 /DNA_START=69 /DNA_END=513 /DNA_ORIENTATION=+